MTFFKQLLITRGHNQGTMNDKKSQFSIKNDIMNHIVNDKQLCSIFYQEGTQANAVYLQCRLSHMDGEDINRSALEFPQYTSILKAN